MPRDRVHVTGRSPASPEAVWAVARDFCGHWHPFIASIRAERSIADPLARTGLTLAELAGHAVKHARGGVASVFFNSDGWRLEVCDAGPAMKMAPELKSSAQLSSVRLHARPGDVAVQGVVELAEISGSDTFIHAATPWGELVAQITGVHYVELGSALALHVNPADAYVFGADGALAVAPQRGQ